MASCPNVVFCVAQNESVVVEIDVGERRRFCRFISRITLESHIISKRFEYASGNEFPAIFAVNLTSFESIDL